jgi:hypothetical protein
MSLKELHNELIDIQLTHLWNQWSVLGVAGYNSANSHIIDPESLLLFTLGTARYDARLYDEVIDWCSVNGELLSIPRIKSLLKMFTVKKHIGALAELLSSKTRTQKWKKLVPAGNPESPEPLFMNIASDKPLPVIGEPDVIYERHGLSRSRSMLRGLSNPIPTEELGGLVLRLRALTGVTVRCEIITALLDGSEKHPSQIARETIYYQKTVQDTISEMVRSGYLHQRTHGREKRYSLEASFRNFITGGRPVKFIPWVFLYDLLNRINSTVLIAFQKGLSPQAALVLCHREIEHSENQLFSAGYNRESLRLKKIEELPKMIGMLLAP